MSINEFVSRLNGTIRDIENDRSSTAVKITLDSLALVKRRVINTGKDSEGGSFGRYSKAVVPFFYYYGKETNRSNKQAVEDLKKKYGFFASYRDWRDVNNLQTEFINFSFTNRMWNSLVPVVLVDNKDRSVVGIQAKTSNEEDKVKFQNARFGDILALSKDERDLLKQINEQRILDAFEKNGL